MKFLRNIFNRKKERPLWLLIIEVLFIISSAVFGIFLIIEVFEPGFVVNWMNPLWILIVSIITGIIAVTYKSR